MTSPVDVFPGWEGSGLGAQHQGIEEPINPGEVRGKVDKYKVQLLEVPHLYASIRAPWRNLHTRDRKTSLVRTIYPCSFQSVGLQ